MNTSLKTAAFFIALILLLSAVVSAQPTPSDKDLAQPVTIELTAEEQAWISAHPKIVLGTDSSWAPYVILGEDGVVAGGIDIDFINLLNKKLGTNIQLTTGSWAEIVEQAKTRELDGLTTSAPLEERLSHFLFSNAYLRTFKYIVIRKDADFNVQRLKDLAGLRVAVQKGIGYDKKLLAEVNNVTLVESEDSADSVDRVLIGEVDAAVVGSGAPYRLSNNQVSGIIFSYWVKDKPLSFVYSIRNDWPELVALINKGIAAITETERSEILKKYYLEHHQDDIDLNVSFEYTVEEQAWIAEHPIVHTITSEDPPYIYFKDGKCVGISVDLLNVISEQTGLVFQFEMQPNHVSDALKRIAEHKEIDLIASIMPTAERSKNILFTKPYYSSPHFIYTRDDAPFVFAMEDLSYTMVAVRKDSAVHKEMVENYPEIDLLICTSNRDALLAVASGKAFALIGDLLSIPFMINEYGIKNIKVTAQSELPDHELAIGVRKDWPEMISILDKALVGIPAAEKAAVINKWSTVTFDHGINPETVAKWIVYCTSIVLLVIGALLLWTRMLNRRVEERTLRLTESEYRYRALFELSQNGILFADVKTRKFKYANPAAEHLLGYSIEELCTMGVDDIHPPEILDKILRDFKLQAKGETNDVFVQPCLKKDGSIIHASISAARVTTSEGDFAIGFFTDITKRIKAEDTLRESEEQLRNLIEHSPVSIQVHHSDGKLYQSNAAFAKLYAFNEESLAAVYEQYNVLEDDQAQSKGLMPFIKKTFAGENTTFPVYEYDGVDTLEALGVKKPQSVKSWIQTRGFPLKDKAGKVFRVVFMSTDITESIKAQEALSKSSTEFRNLMEQSPLSIQITMPDGKISRVNSAFIKLWGLSHNSLPELYEKFNALEDEQTQKLGMMPLIEKAYQGEQVTLPPIQYDAMETLEKLKFDNPQGRKRWIQGLLYPVKDTAGKVQNIVQIEEDITDRIKAQEALSKSEFDFRNLMEQSPLSIQISSPDGKTLQVNSAFMKLWNIPAELLPEMYEKYNIFEDEQVRKQGIMPLIEKAYQGEQVNLPPIPYDSMETLEQFHVGNPQGRKRWIQALLYPLKDNDGNVQNIILISEDITERKMAEEELQQTRAELIHATRTESLAEMTAALAHELNHPLGSILNNANAAKRYLEKDPFDIDEIREIINDIISEDRRASDVMQKLRSLMRKNIVEFESLQINTIIEDVLDFTRSERVINKIELAKELSADLPAIQADRVQLQQVFLNLIINAVYAMKKSSLKNLYVSTAQQDEGRIIVCVKDTGSGINSNDKDCVFNPFFTTKKEGMGMGLSVARTIIKAHSGEIWIENNSDSGACFFVSLPV